MATAHLPPESADVIRPNHFPPAAAGRIAASLLNRHSPHDIAEAVEVLVDVLDLLGGDPDTEGDPFNEGEPAFDAASRAMVNSHPDTDPDHHGDAAWIERIDQSQGALVVSDGFGPMSIGSVEDSEEDDPQGEVTDDDPAFDKRSLAIANRSASGPGCIIGDPDRGAEDDGEIQTWSHPNDHPAELFIGKRPEPRDVRDEPESAQ